MTTQVTISKAVGPLLISALLALYAYFTGAGELAAVATPVVGLITFGAVYLIQYGATKYNKTIAAFVIPLLSALLLAWQTGDFGQPELLLAIQSIVGAIATYLLRYQVPTVPVSDGGN